MGLDSDSWTDAEKQVTTIVAAGGLDKPLFLKGSGTGAAISHMPGRVDKTASATLTAAEVLTRYISYTSGGAGNITLPSAVDLAAAINGPNASRNGTKLWVGASFEFTIATVGGAAVATLVPGTGWTLFGGVDAVDANTQGTWIFRFDGVQVGAETITAFPKGGVI